MIARGGDTGNEKEEDRPSSKRRAFQAERKRKGSKRVPKYWVGQKVHLNFGVR